MNKTIRAVRRGVKAGLKAASGPPSRQRFQAGGRPVVCTQCGNDGFHRYGPIGVTFSGYGLECSNWTHIEYFSKRPKEVEEGA
jgi:hypothetical protein